MPAENDDSADKARAAILLWEQDPKRQAIAKLLGIPPSLVTDEMIRRTDQGFNTRSPNLQQIPRPKK